MRALPAAAALLLALAAPAGAVEPVLGLRLGLAAGLGDAARDVPLTEVAPVQLPLQLDVLGREGPVALGLYGGLALAHAGTCTGASCSAWAARLGLQGTWSFALGDGLEPWAGLGVGLEWLTQRRTQGGGTVTMRYEGVPLVVQGGVEWRLGRWLALGPYGALSPGRYARYTLDSGLASATVSIPDRAWHLWVEAGLRGRLLLREER